MFTKRWRRAVTIAAAAVITAALFAGCSLTNNENDGTQWKTAVAAAYEKNEQIANYAFEGGMKLSPTTFGQLAPESSPLIGRLTGLLSSEDGLSWKGAAYAEPLQLEADLLVKQGDEPYNIPLLIQDNKLYISIPTLNKENEYIVFDDSNDSNDSHDSNGADASSPFDPSMITKLLKTLDEVVPAAIAAADPKWVTAEAAADNGSDSDPEMTNDALVDSDETNPITVKMTVTENNAANVAEALRQGLDSAGIASAVEDTPQLVPGGTISALINADGFIAEQHIDVSFTDGGSLKLNLVKTQINDQPKMTKEIPSDVLSFSDILTFLAADRAAAQQ